MLYSFIFHLRCHDTHRVSIGVAKPIHFLKNEALHIRNTYKIHMYIQMYYIKIHDVFVTQTQKSLTLQI